MRCGNRTGHKISEITANGVVVTDAEGNIKVIEADTVISAFGMRPDSDISNRILDKYNPFVIPVGDCLGIGAIEGAVRGGFFAAWSL